MSEAATATPPAAAPAEAPAASPAPAPTTAAAPTPAAPATAPAPAATPAAPAPSLLARAAAAAPSPAPAPADAPASPIPAKYQVTKDDGSIDEAASLTKWSEGHKNLEQRLGAGDAPPATPEDYAPKVPEGMTLDTLKADPLFKGFLKGAHARGMSNADVSFVLEAYQHRLQMANTPEAGEAELRKEWPTDDQLQRGLADCYRATKAFAGSDEALATRIEKKFGNDPDFVRLMANIGKELQEDTSVHGGLNDSELQTREQLMSTPAYLEPKHPDHAVTVAKVQAMYAKQFGGR